LAQVTQIIVYSDGLGLQQLAMRQQHPRFLTAQRLHMHRAVKAMKKEQALLATATGAGRGR